MEVVDNGVVYMDIMSWLLSSNEEFSNANQDERMLVQLSELIVHLRLDLFDRLMTTLIHSERFWSMKIPDKLTPFKTKDISAEAQDECLVKNASIEPFRSIFMQLKSACLAKFNRSSSLDSNHLTFHNTSSSNQVHDNLPKLKANEIKFIKHWRKIVLDANHIPQEHPSTNFNLRKLCLISVILMSIKPFCPSSFSSHSHSRLRKSIEQDCIKFINQSLIQQSTSSASSASINLAVDHPLVPVITWLAAQIIPSIHPINLAESSTNVIVACLIHSLCRVFEDGNLFNQLSTSLDPSPSSLNLRPSSSTHENLIKVSNDPLAQIVLSISLSISQLIENSSTIFDLESFQAQMTRLAQMTQTIHETWRVATRSLTQTTLPKFEEDSTSVSNNDNSIKSGENLINIWLRNTFFCCLLIVGGLVNKFATVDRSEDLLIKLLKPSFGILYQIHFIGMKFTSDKISTYQVVFDCLSLLSKPNQKLTNSLLKEFQPPLAKSQHIPDPVRVSEVIFFLNLTEKFTGLSIETEYLNEVVVPLIWSYVNNKTQLGFHAQLSLVKVLEFCSRETLLGLADKYFDLLILGVTRDDESSILNFDHQKIGWITLLKSVSTHSKLKTQELISKLVTLIKEINPTRSSSKPDPTRLLLLNKLKNKKDTKSQNEAQDYHDRDRDDDGSSSSEIIRKKLYKLLICSIGELNYEEEEIKSSSSSLKRNENRFQNEFEVFLNLCWDLIHYQEDLIELFEVGLNQKTSKFPFNLQNFVVTWWLKKINQLNNLASVPKL